jgi:hypothetical protein
MNIYKQTLQFFFLLLFCIFSPVHAAGPIEDIISVETRSGHRQAGVLSRNTSDGKPTKLLVIVSGYPGVTRPFLNSAGHIQTKQDGNFLVRSRQYLRSEKIATLLLDCRSDFDSECPDKYQASVERSEDIQSLVRHVKELIPSLQEVWAVSTSRGVITTAGLAKHAPLSFAGLIHTAGTYGKALDQGLSFKSGAVKQYFFHHKHDPCAMTFFRDAAAIASDNDHPLVSVLGGGGFRGQACQAFTQHGFTGQEEKVGQGIRHLVETSKIGRALIE